MCAKKMHPDQLDIDDGLVRRLLEEQFPQWAALSLEPVDSAGTVNALYRLGPDMVVRLPFLEHWATDIEKEWEWLPRLKPELPLEIPEPVALGRPSGDYPFAWSILRWIDGDVWDEPLVDDPLEAARDLARFIKSLQALETTGAKEARFSHAGLRLIDRDEFVRPAIAACEGKVDTRSVTDVWDKALALPPCDKPVLLHGDVNRAGNLIVRNGRLHAVLDWGGIGYGDPASELLAAWSLFSGDSRTAFRSELPFDEETWTRARGWAMTAVIGIPYYGETNPVIVEECLRLIDEVLADPHR